MKYSESPLSEKIGGQPSEERVQAMWANISGRLEPKPFYRTGKFAYLSLSLASAALVFFFVWNRGNSGVSEHLRAKNGASIAVLTTDPGVAERRVELSDGSELRLAGNTTLSAAENTENKVSFVLERGSAFFSVAKVPDRSWTVHAAGVDVVVTGTEFRVSRKAQAVEVTVEEGSVRVLAPNGIVRNLRGGERLRISTRVQELASTTVEKDSTAAIDAGIEVSTDAGSESTEVVQVLDSELEKKEKPFEKTADLSKKEKRKAVVKKISQVENLAVDGSESAIIQAAALPRSQLARAQRKWLLKLANRSRAQGNMQAAVVFLDILANEHRDSVSAFALGRLHLVVTKKYSNAVVAFERGLALGLPDSLKEQAIARWGEACELAGKMECAARARKQYRLHFPQGKILKD